ncbi:indole-3-glycerol phosphate synthase TrpC [Jeotgalibacillus haloalkalitolerans]|uniref:Indole-3-glycerol phosphate synthase n=1 Tax=Jeotgalibacillus haloalkalitolerans TaxID=3104292 RepID=A0ABU5KL61_9BACL|nr:indole-3-glycerol phosphate synthase TrpC [Jeotgalibacillus sp. HH7-29]MDZ5711910.1 indole-3-glycerol phosphate synthase TrpC [Jeotgalibacillus sp. HH7-29]
MTILDKIIEKKKEELAYYEAEYATDHIKPLPFNIQKSRQMNVIAEIKRASPSKGLINPDMDPVTQAKLYEDNGASAISVLTDESFFQGSFDDLKAVAEAVSIPVLCKDFMIDKKQIDRAANAGASIILLIVAALSDELLHELNQHAKKLNLSVLTEVHNEEELQRALAAKADIIGVNNRDLKTFEVDLKVSAELGKVITAQGLPFVSESGIFTAADAETAAKTGASAVLVGESLMKAQNTGELLRSLQVPLSSDSYAR